MVPLSAPHEAICCAAVAQQTDVRRINCCVWPMDRTITGTLAKRATVQTVVSIPAPPLCYSAEPAWGLDSDAYQHACSTTWPRHMVAWQGAKVESLKRNCAKAAQASSRCGCLGQNKVKDPVQLGSCTWSWKQAQQRYKYFCLRKRNSAFKKQMGFLFWGIISEPKKFRCLRVANICFRVCWGLRQEKLQINVCDRWRTSAGWNFSPVLLNVHCSLSSKHLHWTEVRNVIWSSRTESSVFLLVFLGEGVVLWSPSGFSRHVSARLLRCKLQQSGVFSPVRKNLYFGLSSKHLSRRLVLMISSEADCRQAFSFSQSGSQLWCYWGRSSVKTVATPIHMFVIVQVKKGQPHFVLDSLTSIHLPWTQILALCQLKSLI